MAKSWDGKIECSKCGHKIDIPAEGYVCIAPQGDVLCIECGIKALAPERDDEMGKTILQRQWLSQVDSEVCKLLDDLKKKFRDRAKYWAEKTPEGDRTDTKFVAKAIVNTVLDEYQHALFI